jgi:hypothetical protein
MSKIKDEFWVITPFFNPAKYHSLLNNYFCFSENLKKQNINLLTVECAFNDDKFQIPSTENVVRLKSNSIMWQKERLINYGVEQLPSSCKYFAWVDCDIFFPDGWDELAVKSLEKNDLIQLFKKIYHLKKGMINYDGTKVPAVQSVIWQYKIHSNWLNRRKNKDLSFSAPGFAWAAKRDCFSHVGGVYDKNIVGSGDTFLVDCLLNSWEIHGFAKKFTEPMKLHMNEWKEEFLKKLTRLIKLNSKPKDE